MNIDQVISKGLGKYKEVSGYITKVFTNHTQTGKTYYRGYLSADDKQSLVFMTWKDVTAYQGKTVTVSCNQGIEHKNDKQGRPMLSIPDEAVFREQPRPSRASSYGGGKFNAGSYGKPVSFKPTKETRENFDSLVKFYKACFNAAEDSADSLGIPAAKHFDFVTNMTNSLFATRNNHAVCYDEEEPLDELIADVKEEVKQISEEDPF